MERGRERRDGTIAFDPAPGGGFLRVWVGYPVCLLWKSVPWSVRFRRGASFAVLVCLSSCVLAFLSCCIRVKGIGVVNASSVVSLVVFFGGRRVSLGASISEFCLVNKGTKERGKVRDSDVVGLVNQCVQSIGCVYNSIMLVSKCFSILAQSSFSISPLMLVAKIRKVQGYHLQCVFFSRNAVNAFCAPHLCQALVCPRFRLPGPPVKKSKPYSSNHFVSTHLGFLLPLPKQHPHLSASLQSFSIQINHIRRPHPKITPTTRHRMPLPPRPLPLLLLRRRLGRLLGAPKAPTAEPVPPRFTPTAMLPPTNTPINHVLDIVAEQPVERAPQVWRHGDRAPPGRRGACRCGSRGGWAGFEQGAARPFAGARSGVGGGGGRRRRRRRRGLGGPAGDDGVVGGGGHVVEGGVVAAAVAGEGGGDLWIAGVSLLVGRRPWDAFLVRGAVGMSTVVWKAVGLEG